MRYVLPLIFGWLGLCISVKAGNVASVDVSLHCLSTGSGAFTASNSGVDSATASLRGCDGQNLAFYPQVGALASTGFISHLEFGSDTGGTPENGADLTGSGTATSEYMLTLPSDSLVFVYADVVAEHGFYGVFQRSIHFGVSTPWDSQGVPDPVPDGIYGPPVRVEFAVFHTPAGPAQMYPIAFTAWSLGYSGSATNMSGENGNIVVIGAGYTLPEPSSGLLIGFGLIAVAGLRIRRRKKA
jgi:hypothetical protein